MYRYKLFFIFSIFLILFGKHSLSAQTKGINRGKYRIHITSTDKAINIDGVLDEETWLTAERAGKFHRVTPTDTGYAVAQTEVMLTYDESNLYLGIICYDPTPGKRPVQSLRRDFNFSSNDNFMVFIDTYNDMTNGFAFGVSEAGAQRDGMEANGDNVAYTWDIKWKSAVKSYDDRWTAEFSIPFRSMRYFEGATEWGINFGRLDLKTNEKSAWAPMPRQFNHNNLAYAGTLVWDKPLKKARMGFSVIPYIAGKVTKDNEAAEDTKWNATAGFDAKMILSTSMNLDLTVNPDYSQVEEDQQITNLDRFELFFPERRQFFLENTDLFANLGRSGIQPFFSRRIGLNIPVIGGGRLSGQIGDGLRIGVMDMQTGSKDDIPSTNFATAVLQRRVFNRSNIVAFLINKQVTGSFNDSLYSGSRYNRVAGLEYNLASSDDRWSGKMFYHQAFYPGASAGAATASGNLTYSTQYLLASLTQSWVGSDFVAEAGYIRRTGYYETTPGIKYTFYPANSNILSHGPGIDFDIILDPDLKMIDRQTQLKYIIGWKNRNMVTFSLSEQYVKLSRDFDPTNTDGQKLEAGNEFNWQSAGIMVGD
jgi:hypothetical protein